MSSREAPGWYAVLICYDLMEDVSLSHCIGMTRFGTASENGCFASRPGVHATEEDAERRQMTMIRNRP